MPCVTCTSTYKTKINNQWTDNYRRHVNTKVEAVMEEETETDTNEIKTAGTAEEIHGEEEEDIKVVVVVGGGEEAEADTVVTAAIAMTG